MIQNIHNFKVKKHIGLQSSLTHASQPPGPVLLKRIPIARIPLVILVLVLSDVVVYNKRTG